MWLYYYPRYGSRPEAWTSNAAVYDYGVPADGASEYMPSGLGYKLLAGNVKLLQKRLLYTFFFDIKSTVPNR